MTVETETIQETHRRLEARRKELQNQIKAAGRVPLRMARSEEKNWVAGSLQDQSRAAAEESAQYAEAQAILHRCGVELDEVQTELRLIGSQVHAAEQARIRVESAALTKDEGYKSSV